MPKYKDRYVLGVGYPDIDCNAVLLWESAKEDHGPVDIDWPKELYSVKVPCYRLVLEKEST
jgi:hypothetical protein